MTHDDHLNTAPERPDFEPILDPASRWPPWTAFGVLGAALLVVILVSVVIVAVAVAAGAETDSPGVGIALTAVQACIFVGAALFFAQLVSIPRAADFGLRGPSKLWLALVLVPVVWLVFIGVSQAWVTIIGQDVDEDLPDELGADESDVALVAVMLLVCILAPVAEEFIFRGYIFRALRNWKGLWPAALLSGALFGSIHAVSADPVALLPLALLGVGMALVYHYTESLYTAMALHALNNAIAFSVSQDWEWQIPLVIVGAIGATLLLGRGVQGGIDAGHARLTRQRA